MQLSDFTPGTRVYSAKYKTHGTVDHPAKKLVHVLMDNTGKVRPLAVSDLSIVHESRPQREFRETPPKLRSTRFTSTRVPPEEPTVKHNRAWRRSHGVQDTSRMMLRS